VAGARVWWFLAVVAVPIVLAVLALLSGGGESVQAFAAVWLLCALAFLAGSAVTWLLFVRGRPRYPAHPLYRAAPRRARHRAPRLRRLAVSATDPPAPSEPALANLDTHGSEPAARHPGSSAAGALDRLGVARAGPLPPAVEIPAQAGPVDDPPPGESR
jgi:hypothetical protein